MDKNQFKIDDINVGDDLLIYDEQQTHHNLFWRVVSKLSKQRLLVEIKEMGYAAKCIIPLKNVINLAENVISNREFNY